MENNRNLCPTAEKERSREPNHLTEQTSPVAFNVTRTSDWLTSNRACRSRAPGQLLFYFPKRRLEKPVGEKFFQKVRMNFPKMVTLGPSVYNIIASSQGRHFII